MKLYPLKLIPLFLNAFIICESWYSTDCHDLALTNKLKFFTCTHGAYIAIFPLKDTTWKSGWETE